MSSVAVTRPAHVAAVTGITQSRDVAEGSPCYSPPSGEKTEWDPRHLVCPANQGVPLYPSSRQQPHTPCWPSPRPPALWAVVPVSECARTPGRTVPLTGGRFRHRPQHTSQAWPGAPLLVGYICSLIPVLPGLLKRCPCHLGAKGPTEEWGEAGPLHLLCGSQTRQPWAGITSRPLEEEACPPPTGRLTAARARASSPRSHGVSSLGFWQRQPEPGQDRAI